MGGRIGGGTESRRREEGVIEGGDKFNAPGEVGREKGQTREAMIERVCRGLFSVLALRSAGSVLLVSNPVHAVLFLVLTFMNASGRMRLLEAEFRALLFRVVYVGAIAVLFLFVVMMLNLARPTGADFVKDWNRRGLRRGGVIFTERVRLSSRLAKEQRGWLSWDMRNLEGDRKRLGIRWYEDWLSRTDGVTNMETLGQVLYTEYALYVVLAGFVLLVAMVGAIVLTLQERRFAVAKRQQAYQQISRDSSRAIRRVR